MTEAQNMSGYQNSSMYNAGPYTPNAVGGNFNEFSQVQFHKSQSASPFMEETKGS
jgi:hypothetical protein